MCTLDDVACILVERKNKIKIKIFWEKMIKFQSEQTPTLRETAGCAYAGHM